MLLTTVRRRYKKYLNQCNAKARGIEIRQAKAHESALKERARKKELKKVKSK